jgi:hypothetical protein
MYVWRMLDRSRTDARQMLHRSRADARKKLDACWTEGGWMLDGLNNRWIRWLYATATERCYVFFSHSWMFFYSLRKFSSLMPVHKSSQYASTVWSNRRWFPGTLLVILPSLGYGKSSGDPPACYHSYDPTADLFATGTKHFAMIHPLLACHNSPFSSGSRPIIVDLTPQFLVL